MKQNNVVEYLFDSSGGWIAFRKGKYIFNPVGIWIGWLPWDKSYVVNKTGEYLGTIIQDDDGYGRFYRFSRIEYRGYPGLAPTPQYPGYPGHPGFITSSLLPMMAEDISVMEMV